MEFVRKGELGVAVRDHVRKSICMQFNNRHLRACHPGKQRNTLRLTYNANGALVVYITTRRVRHLKLIRGPVVVNLGTGVTRVTRYCRATCPGTGVLCTARGSFAPGDQGRFFGGVGGGGCSYVVVSRSRFTGVPRSPSVVQGVLRTRLSSMRRGLRAVQSRKGSMSGTVVGNLRGQGLGLGTGLRGVTRSVSRHGSSVVSFTRVNVSRVFISRDRRCGGLAFGAQRAHITKLKGSRNDRGTLGLLFTVHAVRRHANESLKTAFLSKAAVSGDLARLCLLFGCLHPLRLGERGVGYFST